jgi:hypothetical protein
MHMYTHIEKCIDMIYIYITAPFSGPTGRQSYPQRYTLLRPSGGSAGSCSRTAAQQWVNAVAEQHSRRSKQQQEGGWVGGQRHPLRLPLLGPVWGLTRAGLTQGPGWKRHGPWIYMYILICIYIIFRLAAMRQLLPYLSKAKTTSNSSWPAAENFAFSPHQMLRWHRRRSKGTSRWNTTPARKINGIKLSRLQSSYSTPWLPCNYHKACLCQTRLLCYNISQTLFFSLYLCLFDYLDRNSTFT